MRGQLKLLTILAITLVNIPSIAKQRTESEIKDLARAVLSQHAEARSELKEYNDALQIVEKLDGLSIVSAGDKGFAVISNDDETVPIMGYSFTSYNKENEAEGFTWWKNAVNNAISNGTYKSMKSQNRIPSSCKPYVEPLVKTRWGQRAPYNAKCPIMNGKRCLTGCVATAIAQLLYYYHYPLQGTGSYNGFDYGNTIFEWGNMRHDYKESASSIQKDAVATLMYACGIASNMNYGTDESYAYFYDSAIGMNKYLGFTNVRESTIRYQSNNEDWMKYIYERISVNSSPIIYRGDANDGNSGHAFILDGYDQTGNIHVNWGWNGDYDGYYNIDAMNPNADNYSFNQFLIYDNYLFEEHPELMSKRITVSGSRTAGTSHTINAEITNYGKAFNGQLHLFVSKTEYDTGTHSSHQDFSIGSDDSKTFSTNYTPPTDGTYYLWLTADEAGKDIVGKVCLNIGDGEQIIEFKDQIVKNYCLSKFDTNSDYAISMNEASCVSSIGEGSWNSYQPHNYESPIINATSFEELQYFTSATFIPSEFFRHCRKLNSVKLPNSITAIGLNCFQGCYNLTDIELSNSLEIIHDLAFNACGFKRITLPESLNRIGYSAFAYCTALTDIDIPNNVEYIREQAFLGCKELKSVNIPSSSTSIYYATFSGCSNLSSVTIPNSITKIGSWAFDSCCKLNNVILPESVTAIEEGAFNGCEGLSNISLPSSLIYIGAGAFQNCSELKDLIIPKYVNTIDSFAFNGCKSLKSVKIPESVTAINKYSFKGCSSLSNIAIPNSILAINEGAFLGCNSLTSISLPSSLTYIGYSAFDCCYSLKDLIIPNYVTTIDTFAFADCKSLKSIRIPKSVKQIKSWAFGGCSPNMIIVENPTPIVFNDPVFTSYDAVLVVPVGSKKAYENAKEWKGFKKIIEGEGPTIVLYVKDEDNADISNKVNITWYDPNGNTIGTDSKIPVIEGAKYYYSIELDDELGRIYHEVKKAEVVADVDNVTCKLKRIDNVPLEGRVSAYNIDTTPITVNIKQILNGKYEQTYSTETDAQGVFRIEILDGETTITFCGDNYFDETIHRDGFNGNGNIGTIPMSKLKNGVAIAANITIQKAVTIHEAAETTVWDENLNNIQFTLTNKTEDKPITDFIIKTGRIYIKADAEIGDEILIEAESKKNEFANAVSLLKISDNYNSFDLHLVELGGLDATFDESQNISTVGYLYDNENHLISQSSYVGEKLSLRKIKSGFYTLVSLGNNALVGRPHQLQDFTDMGLIEGSDYVISHVEIADGEVTEVKIETIPHLDNTHIQYTSNNTYFNSEQSSVNTGNHITLSTRIDFKPKYRVKVNDVILSIDIPKGCEFVRNSLIVNRQPIPYTLKDNYLTMTLKKEQWQSKISFCIIPTINKLHSITAMVSFDIDGQVTQPIGIAQFKAKGLSLNTPDKTDNTNIVINGTAKGHSEVRIYDSEVLIGKTFSKADGSWTTQCELYKPYNHSFHNIYAKITTESGMELTSETQQVEYQKINLVPEKVTMLYYNPEFDTNYNIVFDLINGTTTPSYYYYFPYKNWPNWWKTYETEPKDFTFLADFTRNDSSQIKNVSIKVLNSDGTIRTLPATFDGKQGKWVATTKYASSNRIPQNVTMEYDLLPTEVPFDSLRIIDDNNQFKNLVKNYIIDIDSTKFEVINANESIFICKYQTFEMETPVYIRIEELDYDVWINELEREGFLTIENNGNTTYIKSTSLDNLCLNWIWTKEDKKMLQLEISQKNDFSHLNMSRNSLKKSPPTTVTGGFINAFFSILGISNTINEYNNGYADLQFWLRKYEQTIKDHSTLYNKTKQLLEAKCPDGSLRLYSQAYDWYSTYLGFYFNHANTMREEFKMRIEWMERSLVDRRNSAMAINAALSALTTILPETGFGKFMAQKFGTAVTNKFGGTIRNWVLDNLGEAIESAVLQQQKNQINTALEWLNPEWLNNDWYTSGQLNSWYFTENKMIIKNYSDLQDLIQKAYLKCKEEEEKEDEPLDEKSDNKPDFKGNGSTGLSDPSGYVYEAVLTNRLEGVTTTCYQQENGVAVVWNAEDYSQQNPLKTDKAGFYRWDVPQGMWQVKYEKEGYETAYSDWLPVPPPQLDVNIGMKQSTPPTVKQMRGYESGITIELSKYMRPETMTTEKITVTRNGSAEAGSIELMNAEQAPLGNETYVSKVKFVPENRFNATDLVVVTVHKEVESYCGVQMTADHVETVKIESEVKSIVADSLVTVPYQGERELRVLILPKDVSAGRTLKVKTSSAMIASLSTEEVTIGQDGAATLTLGGELPGGAILDFSVDGTDVKATSRVKVVMGREMVATPVANISSGVTISGRTQIELTCETEGATIYYTLDGSCPCDEATRLKYDGPITIATDVIVKAIAVKDDMDDSDIATFVYIVDGIDGINYNSRFDAIYQDGSVVVTGAKGASCHIYDLQGREVATRLHLSNQATISVPKTEIYVVSVTFDDGQTVVKKVVRKQ